MPDSPQAAVESMLTALDAGDRDTVAAGFSDDAQGIDEISCRWLRGRDQMNEYIDGIFDATANVTSAITDVHVADLGEGALVTGILNQSYDLDGDRQQISVPTTFALRRAEDGWLICLFHSVPVSTD